LEIRAARDGDVPIEELHPAAEVDGGARLATTANGAKALEQTRARAGDCPSVQVVVLHESLRRARPLLSVAHRDAKELLVFEAEPVSLAAGACVQPVAYSPEKLFRCGDLLGLACHEHAHADKLAPRPEGCLLLPFLSFAHAVARTCRPASAVKVSQRLDRDGIKLGDRVATIAWNTWRHLEAWYGIMGIGAICHTVNPRLFPEQIAWIINHAEDRVVMVDALGRCVDGDQLLYILATTRHAQGKLKGPVVGTVMSNLGLEHAFRERGIEFHRAQVGDRHVLAMLNEVGGTLGGETSGHILCLDKTTTGDGLICALQVLAVMKHTGAGLAELSAAMHKYPQVLLNVPVARRFDPMTEPRVIEVTDKLQRRFNGRGRIVLRASGTEPVIRVMVEGHDANLVKQGARDIAAVVEAVANHQ